MKTVVLHQKRNGAMYCHALCLESDIENLTKEDRIDYEIMHESLFRTLHPLEYNDYVQSDIPFVLSVWLEQLYSSEKDVSVDEECLFTDAYFIQVKSHESVQITFYIGCSAIEAASLVAFLKDRLVGTLIDLTIDCTTLFSQHSEN